MVGFYNDYPLLASKTLPDGTLLLAMAHGQSVVLVHQIVCGFSLNIAGRSYFSGPEDDNYCTADIQMRTLRTRIISREQFDAGHYEQYVQEPENPRGSPAPHLSKAILMRRPIPALNSKALPDGSILTAIAWGDHVALVHQTILDVTQQELTGSRHLAHGQVNLRANLFTLATKVITRAEYDAAQADYERFLHEQQTLAPPRPALPKPEI